MKSEYKHLIIIIVGFILVGGFLLSKGNKHIDIVGDIVEISDSGQEDIGILVIGEGNKSRYDKAYVTITPRTLIYRGDSSTRIASDELKVGDSVEIILTGEVRESYPVQATGDAVRIKE